MRAPLTLGVVVALGLAGCVYEDVCKDGAHRVAGECTLDGTDAGGADAGTADAGTADGGSVDGGDADGGDVDAGTTDGGAADPVVGIAVGATHVCVVHEMGDVFCWGGNTQGQIGNGSMGDYAAATVDLGGPAVQLASSALTTCARLSDGSVSCWGGNGDAIIDDTTDATKPSPVSVFAGPATSVSVGFANVCVTTAGPAYCRGRNDHGEAAVGDVTPATTDLTMPAEYLMDGTTPTNFESVFHIAPADHHVCYLTAAGDVFCSGGNTEGMLGDGTNVDHAYATPVDTTGGIGTVIDIAAANDHTCAVDTVGDVYCWGANHGGELGSGVSLDAVQRSPIRVPGITAAEQVVIGDRHACALRSDDTVRCWGWQGDGALGNGVTADSALTEPYALPLTDVRQIAAGLGALTCALTASGEVYCWGSNFMTVYDVFRDGERVHATPTLVSTDP